MGRSYEAFVGLRYVRAEGRNRFISFIALASVLSIAIGVIALTTVLSVVNGFERALTGHLIGMETEATIIAYGDSLGELAGPPEDPAAAGWRQVAAQLRQHPEVVGAAPYLQSEAMAARGEAVKGALLRGILPQEERQVSPLAEKMTAGRLDALEPGRFGAVLGDDLAKLLQAGVGDAVSLVLPAANVTPAGLLPRLKRFTVVGIYDTDMYEFDSSVAFIHLQDASRFLRAARPTGLRLKTTDAAQAPRISREALAGIPGRYGVIDWTQRYVNYFRSLKMTKKMMFVVLVLIVAVAAFNIVSTLVMAVTDKQADIAVLRAMGATPRGVMKIFVIQGLAIGGAGILLGAVGGAWLAGNIGVIVPALEAWLQVQFMPPEVYYVSELPAELRWRDLAATAATAFLLTVAATLYPAWRAARTRPAEVLRYE